MLPVTEVSHYYLNPCDLLVPATWIYAESIQCGFTDILPGLNKCKAHQHHMKNVMCEKPFSSAEMVVSGSIPFLQTLSGNISFAYDINCRRNRHAPHHLIHTLFYVMFSYEGKGAGMSSVNAACSPPSAICKGGDLLKWLLSEMIRC